MAAQAVTMAQPWVLDAYHDLVAASLVTPAVGAHPSLPSPHMPQQPPPSHAATAAVPPPPSMPHPHHHLMGTPLTSTISIASPIASPLSPALPIGSPMMPLGTTDPLTSIPAWGNWDTLVATTAAGLPPSTVPCHPEGFYYVDPAWFGKGEPEQPNHVILMTIINPAYPITVDVIHTITQPHGNVLRIVIFKKNGVQCMVEFENVESATRAREALHGADIYAGCCTLRVEYAKPAKLNVYRNDSESWDYTNSAAMEHKGQPSGSSRPPLLQEPRFGGGLNGQMGGPPRSSGLFNSPSGMPDRYGGGGGMELDTWDDRRGGGRDRRFNSRYNSNGMSNGGQRGGVGNAGLAGAAPFMGGSGGPPNTMAGMGGPAPGLPQQGAVLMVYSLNKDRMNADKLFNLLCLYGNVVRIKFLKTKEGCAMVQMGDALAVERAIGNLNNTTFFGSKMQLGYSKQAFLADMQTPFDLPDGTPSFKDYMGNKNNRFINPEQASKNRIQPPSKILHFFNTPPNISESAMKEVFTDEDVAPPKAMKLFQSKTDRSSSGLLEFDDLQEALEALVSCNHARIPNPTGTRFPFIMKLCFSSSRSLQYKSERSEKKDDEEEKWME